MYSVGTLYHIRCGLSHLFAKFPRRTAFAVPPPMRGALPCPARKKRPPKRSLLYQVWVVLLGSVVRLVGRGDLSDHSRVLLGDNSLDDEQGDDHQRDGDDHADHHVLHQTGDDEADEGNGSHGDAVGDLGGHMVQVVAVRTSGSHDGGIGDGGQVVAAHAAGAGSGQTDGQQVNLGRPVKHSADQGDHDADGAPGRTGSEADEAGHDEDHGGQELSQVAGVGHDALHERADLQTVVTAQAAQRPGEAQDQDGGDHLDKAVGYGLEGLLEADQTAQPVIDEREHNGHDRAQAQARTSGRIGEGHDEVAIVVALGIPHTAGPDQADDAQGDQHDNGQQQIQHGGVLRTLLVIVSAGEGTMLGGEQVVLHLGVVLMGQHRAVVDVEHGDDDDHHQSQNAVIVPGDLAQEHGDTGAGEAFGHVGRNGGGPGGHGSQHTHGGGSGVDDVRQLGPGDLVGLGDGTHNSAHGQAVEIVVDEDQHAQQHGQQLRAHAGLHGLLGPAAEGGRAAGLVHQVHHDAQDHQEDQDGDVDGVDHTNTLAGTDKVHYRLPGSEVSQQQRRDQAAQEQRGIHFLADQGQGDGDHGGEQSPAGGHKAGTVVGDLGDDQRHDDDRQGYAIRDLCTFLFHVCDLPPHKLVPPS